VPSGTPEDSQSNYVKIIGGKQHQILHIHPISFHLISLFLGMSKDVWSVAHLWMQGSFLKQSEGLDNIEK
jgi:hypothetical protein